jgi:prepilin-type N-terminal cleavage/methylation domain-containing protein
MLRKNAGFSMTELMVVIGIIALMCGIAMPSIIGWLPKYRMGSAARDILGTLEFARLTAVKRNTTTLVTLDYANDLVRVTVGTDFVRTVRMPAGIDLKESVPPSLGASFNFNGQGMVEGNKSGELLISDGGRHPNKTVTLSTGGSIKIQ